MEKKFVNQYKNIFLKIKKYFWDINFSYEIFDTNKEFVIERIAEGNVFEGYILLEKLYGKDYCFDIIKNSKRCSNKTKNYWELLIKSAKKDKKGLKILLN
jgi:hypothetical protein